jgi:hypothetical protein
MDADPSEIEAVSVDFVHFRRRTMPMIPGNCTDVRERVRSSDVIVFGGKHAVSRFTEASSAIYSSTAGGVAQ